MSDFYNLDRHCNGNRVVFKKVKQLRRAYLMRLKYFRSRPTSKAPVITARKSRDTVYTLAAEVARDHLTAALDNSAVFCSCHAPNYIATSLYFV